jgi:uncharacterized protein YbbK (DUF523 family)
MCDEEWILQQRRRKMHDYKSDLLEKFKKIINRRLENLDAINAQILKINSNFFMVDCG